MVLLSMKVLLAFRWKEYVAYFARSVPLYLLQCCLCIDDFLKEKSLVCLDFPQQFLISSLVVSQDLSVVFVHLSIRFDQFSDLDFLL